MLDIKPTGSADTEPCSVFRYNESTYISGNSLVTKSSWTLMKRRSNGSYSPLDDAREVSPDWVVINCKEPVPGKLYRAVFRPGPVDYWTGYVEEWEWEMVPHE